MRLHTEVANIRGATNQIHIWADGIHGDDSYDDRPARTLFRLHRDGAATYATRLGGHLATWDIPRKLNAQIAYLVWLWDKIGLRNPVEIIAQLVHLQEVTVIEHPRFGFADPTPLGQPIGAPPVAVRLRVEMLPLQLGRASVRHRFLRDFGDRLEQAFGRRRMGPMFRNGWLYGRNGSLGACIYGPGIWIEDKQVGFVDRLGVIRHGRGHIVGYFIDGVVVDNEGFAVAALELAAGPALPDDFRAKNIVERPFAQVPGAGDPPPEEPREEVELPSGRGQWSEKELLTLLTE
jgi:hypothetical protein